MKKFSEDLIATAFSENLNNIDITTDVLKCSEIDGRAQLIADSDLILSGSDLFTEAICHKNRDNKVKWHFADGDKVLSGQTVATVMGNLSSIITAEQIGLNLLMRLSGISTLASSYVKIVHEFDCKISDTLQTTVGLRWLEKRAVTHGGGINSRLNLSDNVLINKNHISLFGGLTKLLSHITNEMESTNFGIIVESEADAQVAYEYNIGNVVLNAISLKETEQILKVKPKTISVDYLGDINLNNLKEFALLDINCIRIPKLTESAPYSKFSLNLDWREL